MLDNDSLPRFTYLRIHGPPLQAWQLSVERRFSVILSCSEAYEASIDRGGERRGCNNAGLRPRGIILKLPRLELCGLTRCWICKHIFTSQYLGYYL